MQLMLKLLDCNVTAFMGARPAAQTLLSGKRPDLMILEYQHAGGQRAGHAGICQTPRRME